MTNFTPEQWSIIARDLREVADRIRAQHTEIMAPLPPIVELPSGIALRIVMALRIEEYIAEYFGDFPPNVKPNEHLCGTVMTRADSGCRLERDHIGPHWTP